MPRDKEKKKEYDRLNYIANKDKISEQCRLRYIANKEKIKERSRLYKKLWRKTPQGKKQNTMNTWRSYGVNNVNDTMYDRYINTHCCDICNKEFKNSLDRCLDHDHDTGDFRQILCQSCNNHDSWKKKIEAEN